MIKWVEPGSDWLEDRNTRNFFANGRLKPGVNARQAESSLNLLAQQLAKEYPETNEGQSIKVVPPGFILPDLRGAVVNFTWVLMGAVALVLVVTCTNLAGLMLARATDRRREIAIRLAMGANRVRLIRQLLTESVLLSVVGGVAGVLLAFWIVDVLLAFKPPIDFPLSMDVNIDWHVLLFSLCVSVLAGAIFGLAPALQATRLDVVRTMRGEVMRDARPRRARQILIAVQVGASALLLICAVIFLRGALAAATASRRRLRS